MQRTVQEGSLMAIMPNKSDLKKPKPAHTAVTAEQESVCPEATDEKPNPKAITTAKRLIAEHAKTWNELAMY
jgi:hypothetical protein